MQNPNQSAQQNFPNNNYTINQSVVSNPLLENMQTMNSCPYYLTEHTDSQPNQQAVSSHPHTQPNVYDSNPYYVLEEPHEQKPVFQNTDIPIKKKDKKPAQKKPIEQPKQQEYIKLDRNGKGNYHRIEESSSGCSCCDCCSYCIDECCTELCVHCAIQVCFQVAIQCICQAIFK